MQLVFPIFWHASNLMKIFQREIIKDFHEGEKNLHINHVTQVSKSWKVKNHASLKVSKNYSQPKGLPRVKRVHCAIFIEHYTAMRMNTLQLYTEKHG